MVQGGVRVWKILYLRLGSLDFLLWAAEAFNLRSNMTNSLFFEEKKSRDEMYDGLDKETLKNFVLDVKSQSYVNSPSDVRWQFSVGSG